MNNAPKLADLIEAARRGGEVSYERLSQACGGQPSAKRLHQLQNGSMKSFPDPDTMRSLARGTGFSVFEILLASARSLELHIPAVDEDTLRIHGLSTVPDHIQELMKELGREIVTLSKSVPSPAPEERQPPESHFYDLAADDHSDEPDWHDALPNEP